MVFIRPSRIYLCTLITVEMLNTGSCHAKDEQHDVAHCTVPICNCEHPPRDPFSMGQEFIYVGKSHPIQLNYLNTAAPRAIFSGFRHHGGTVYGGAQAESLRPRVGRGDGVLFLGKAQLHRRNHHEQERRASRLRACLTIKITIRPIFTGCDANLYRGSFRKNRTRET
jgi:hypothetical protein